LFDNELNAKNVPTPPMTTTITRMIAAVALVSARALFHRRLRFSCGCSVMSSTENPGAPGLGGPEPYSSINTLIEAWRGRRRYRDMPPPPSPWPAVRVVKSSPGHRPMRSAERRPGRADFSEYSHNPNRRPPSPTSQFGHLGGRPKAVPAERVVGTFAMGSRTVSC